MTQQEQFEADYLAAFTPPKSYHVDFCRDGDGYSMPVIDNMFRVWLQQAKRHEIANGLLKLAKEQAESRLASCEQALAGAFAELRAKAEAHPHHPLCNYWAKPVGGPGCICARLAKEEAEAQAVAAFVRYEHGGYNVVDILQSNRVGPKEPGKYLLYTAPPAQAASVPSDSENLSALLYLVERKFPGESRHETAARYIRNAEAASRASTACEAAKEQPK